MRKLGLLTSCLLGALTTGCGSDPGSIAVSWNVGLSDTCEGAGIDTVRVELTEEGGQTLGPFEAPCTVGEDGGVFKVSDVDEGSYSIALEGFDADGKRIYTGRSASRVNVTEGKTATPAPIILSPAPAKLTVGWVFPDPRGCSVQDGAPDEVRIVVFKSNREEVNETTDCELFELVIDDLDADPDYDIRGVALHGSTALFAFEQTDLALEDGEEAEITGEFQPCASVPDLCN